MYFLTGVRAVIHYNRIICKDIVPIDWYIKTQTNDPRPSCAAQEFGIQGSVGSLPCVLYWL